MLVCHCVCLCQCVEEAYCVYNYPPVREGDRRKRKRGREGGGSKMGERDRETDLERGEGKRERD